MRFWRPYLAAVRELAGWRIALVLSVIVAGSLAEGAGLLLLVPLLQVAGIDVQQGTVAGVARLVARAFHAAHIPLTLPFALLIYVGVSAAQAFLQEAQTASNALVQQAAPEARAGRESVADRPAREQYRDDAVRPRRLRVPA